MHGLSRHRERHRGRPQPPTSKGTSSGLQALERGPNRSTQRPFRGKAPRLSADSSAPAGAEPLEGQLGNVEGKATPFASLSDGSMQKNPHLETWQCSRRHGSPACQFRGRMAD